tara:strand:- start:23 stop:214 length:192 start_codon:yes stop_codon:yes gene_type:complete
MSPMIFFEYSVDVKKTDKLVMIKNMKLAIIEVLIILGMVLCFDNLNPSKTMIIKPIYTEIVTL